MARRAAGCKIGRRARSFGRPRDCIPRHTTTCVLPRSRCISRLQCRSQGPCRRPADEAARGPEHRLRGRDGRGSVQADSIRLPLLTGCRKTGIVGPKRREVDGNRLRLEDGKTGPGTLYPSPEARAIVDGRMTAGGAYPFPSPPTPDRPVSGNPGLRFGIRREIGIGDVRPHDPGHSHASRCVAADVPLPASPGCRVTAGVR